MHVAATRLPEYRGARPGDWNGLRSYVDSLDRLTAGSAAAEAGRLPTPDAGLRVHDQRPGRLARAAPRLVEDLLTLVGRRASGFRDGIVDVSVRTRRRWRGVALA